MDIKETPPPVVQFAAATYSVGEGDGSADIEVVFDTEPRLAVSVDYTVVAVTASGNDYTAVASGTLVFAGKTSSSAGEMSKKITISITDDGQAEFDETVKLTLTGVTLGTLGSTVESTLTIVDNDPLQVGVTAGAPTPTLAEIDEEIVTTWSATALNPPSPADGPTYLWMVEKVETSLDGAAWSTAESGYSAAFTDPTTSPTSLTFSAAEGGYWRVTCSAQLCYSQIGNPSATVVGAGSAVGQKTVVEIKRKKGGEDKYEVINDSNRNLLPGELVDLKAEPAAMEYTWTIPEMTFKDYVADVDTAKLTVLAAADKTNQGLSFY